MEIQEIKQQLKMANVLHYYGLKTDKQSRLNCPFHEDKTPSMLLISEFICACLRLNYRKL